MTVGCRSPRPDPEVTEKSELKSIFIERSDVDLLEGSQPEDLGVEVIGSRDQSVLQRFSNLNPTLSIKHILFEVFTKRKKKSFFWSYKVISQNFPKLLSTIYGSVGVHVKIHRQGDKPSFKRMHEKCQKPKLFGLLSSVAAAAAARSYEIGSYKDWFFFRCY